MKALDRREELLAEFYDPHHAALESWMSSALDRFGRCLIIDCHSYPSRPLPICLDQSPDRPDCCIGTAGMHARQGLAQTTVSALKAEGWTCGVDRPYGGSIVPLSRLGQDPRVQSIMIEINRSLYLSDSDSAPSSNYEACRAGIRRVLDRLTGEEI